MNIEINGIYRLTKDLEADDNLHPSNHILKKGEEVMVIKDDGDTLVLVSKDHDGNWPENDYQSVIFKDELIEFGEYVGNRYF